MISRYKIYNYIEKLNYICNKLVLTVVGYFWFEVAIEALWTYNLNKRSDFDDLLYSKIIDISLSI